MKNDLENEIILKLNKYRIKGIIWHEDEIFFPIVFFKFE